MQVFAYSFQLLNCIHTMTSIEIIHVNIMWMDDINWILCYEYYDLFCCTSRFHIYDDAYLAPHASNCRTIHSLIRIPKHNINNVAEYTPLLYHSLSYKWKNFKDLYFENHNHTLLLQSLEERSTATALWRWRVGINIVPLHYHICQELI